MMKIKKIFLSLATIALVVVSAALAAAWEAHVINVTAHIENALRVLPLNGELEFGTVFPQEYHEKSLYVTTSTSFCNPNQRRVLNIKYKIVQKPKPIWPKPDACRMNFATVEEARTYCHENPEDADCCYASLCPYLSKTPRQTDPKPYTDYGVPAFHDPNDPLSVATGTINKDHDISDEWIIDLAVPCFKGMCAQDFDEFVHQYNPDANPDDYILPAELESGDFGCDLWIEATAIY